MPNFAVHDGTTVQNVIVADSLEIAETITGLSAVETTGAPWISWTLDEQGWVTDDPAPFPSWEWDYEAARYVAPVPDPGDGSVWDEESHSWLDVTPLEEESSDGSASN
jgi:hypothetical protein